MGRIQEEIKKRYGKIARRVGRTSIGGCGCGAGGCCSTAPASANGYRAEALADQPVGADRRNDPSVGVRRRPVGQKGDALGHAGAHGPLQGNGVKLVGGRHDCRPGRHRRRLRRGRRLGPCDYQNGGGSSKHQLNHDSLCVECQNGAPKEVRSANLSIIVRAAS